MRGLPPPPGVAPPAGFPSEFIPVSSTGSRTQHHLAQPGSPTSPGSSIHAPTTYASAGRMQYFEHVPLPLTLPTSSSTSNIAMIPRSRKERINLLRQSQKKTSEPGTPPHGSFDEGSSPSSRRTSEDLLHSGLVPPTPAEVGLTRMERAPRRRDTLEKIPMRARSQSWLLRTRRLYDDNKLHKRMPFLSKCLFVLSVLFLILTFPFSIPFCIRVAKEYERAVVFRLGRLIKGGTKGPGLYFIIPCIDTYKIVDLRVMSFDVQPQEILSRDSVTVSVEAVIYFRVSNPVISVTNVNDAQFSTKLLAQTTLRNVLGTKTLSEILQERDNIASVTEKVLDEGTDPWGVKVQRVELKDIRLPHQLMRSMAAEAEATRDARARVIAADGERNASRSLVEAADVISGNKVS
uniref:Band 7 domain-containing protein n=1 Tax=Acrobeloides nanus TaxID=290746 RepID=A0A914BUB4_9BILA